MSKNVAQFILGRVHDEWGVTRIHGYPGNYPHAGRIVKESFKGKLAEFVNR